MARSRHAPDSPQLSHDDRVFAPRGGSDHLGHAGRQHGRRAPVACRATWTPTYGDIIYFSNVLEPRHEFLTANNQTPYVLTVLRPAPTARWCWTCRRRRPRSCSSAVPSTRGRCRWSISGPAGEDAGKGGSYLFLPPGYTGDAPDGYIVVPSPTIFVHVGVAADRHGKGTLEDAVAYSQRLKTYPLAQAANPPANRYIDGLPAGLEDAARRMMSSFLRAAGGGAIEASRRSRRTPRCWACWRASASRRASRSRPTTRGRAAADGGGAARAPRPCRTTSSIARSCRTGRTGTGWPTSATPISATPSTATACSTTTAAPAASPTGRRGRPSGWASRASCRPRITSRASATTSGALFRGDALVSPARAGRYADARFLVGRGLRGGDQRLHPQPAEPGGPLVLRQGARWRSNADGAVDVYIGPAAPKGLEANWIPTAGKDFWLIARFYGPQQPLFDKTWVMPDVEEVK